MLSLNETLSRVFGRRAMSVDTRGREKFRKSAPRRVAVEQLEDRTLLSGWAFGVGGPAGDGGNSIATDSAGNVYVTGNFSGTVDFDPGPGTSNLTSVGGTGDIFVAKYSSSGAFVWARRAGGGDTSSDNGRGIALDSAGNVYVAGNFRWAAATGGTGPASATPFGIAVDGNGNSYTTGGFSGTVDFDPGPAAFNLTNTGQNNVFLSKLDTNGNFVWALRFEGTYSGSGNCIALDSSGNIYTGGVFGAATGHGESATADFDPGPGTAYVTAPFGGDLFVSKLDSSGNFLAARQMGMGPNIFNSNENGIAIDTGGNIYTTGIFVGGAFFDIGTSTANLNSNSGSGDIFVAKTTQEVPTSPQLSQLADGPDPVSNRGTGVLTLTADAIRVVAGGSNVASVSFYRDKNGNGVLDMGTDTLLGTDSDGSNGWRLAVSIPKNFKAGTYSYFAQAKDSANVAGNVVSTTNTVTSGQVAAMVATRDSAAAGVDLVLDSHYSGDRGSRFDLFHRPGLTGDLLKAIRRGKR